MDYKGIETSRPLLVAYEVLALDYKKASSRRKTDLEMLKNWQQKDTPEPSSTDFLNYHRSFALLVLNASIIEGTLRSALSERLSNDIEENIQQEVKQGLNKPSKPQKLLQKFRDEVELQGGWEKLKGHYSFYLDISISSSLSEKTKEAIDTLFILRNVLSHGTALIQANTVMSDDMKDVYPYQWQRKLQRAEVYLRREFGHADILENLAEFGVPEHFLDMTKTLFHEIETSIDAFPPRAAETVALLREYSFGYISRSR